MMTLLWKKPYSIIERLHLICALALETRQRVDVAHQSRIIQKGIQGTQNLAETAGEAIVHSVTGSQEETEESQRAKRQISDIAETIDACHGSCES